METHVVCKREHLPGWLLDSESFAEGQRRWAGTASQAASTGRRGGGGGGSGSGGGGGGGGRLKKREPAVDTPATATAASAPGAAPAADADVAPPKKMRRECCDRGYQRGYQVPVQ